MSKLVRRGRRISEKKARDFVLAMARLGNHYEKLATANEVQQFFAARGLDFRKVLDDVCDGGLITGLENLVGPNWQSMAEGPGIRTAIVRADTGEEVIALDGEAQISSSVYWAAAERACNFMHTAIERNSYEDLKSAIERGVASVEAYLSYRAMEWNRLNVSDRLLDDAENKISFKDKIDKWIPKMTGGKIATGALHSQHFQILKKFRDDVIVHPKSVAQGITAEQFKDLVDKFRTGFAHFLIDLHVLFKERVPSIIIREAYSADAIVERSTP